MPVPDGHATVERRSLASHTLIAERLDEPLRRRAQQTLERWAAAGALAPPYVAAWRAVLALPLDELAAELTRDDERMRDLRQCSPFAGALAPEERWAVLRAVR